MTEPALLEVSGLRKSFNGAAALDGADLEVRRGETLALAGASGSGKTTLARCVLKLIEPDAGEIRVAGHEVTALSGGALRLLRRRIQMVFQDPMAAFNPRATIARIIGDPLRIHDIVPRAERREAVLELLDQVRLPAELASRKPHEISGGQRQRVAIARAIATKPELVVLDEPVSSLDVSVRARILNLLLDLQERSGVAYLLITHDLAAVRAVAGRVAIMAAGRIVETGNAAEILKNPQAEPTRALVAAVPRLKVQQQ
jgi:peptide/nickel transport system ATP-binding protein